MKKTEYLTLLVVALTLFVTVSFWKSSLYMDEITAFTRSKVSLTQINEESKMPSAMLNRSSHGYQIPRKLSLSPQVINGIKKFVFFVGYSRSGHSIIGTLMDAHPHVVISNEFLLFKKFDYLDKSPKETWKDNLFNLIYKRSVQDVTEERADPQKGYTLGVDGMWQGRFDEYIEVLGDKGGGGTTRSYMENKNTFRKNYEKLTKLVSVPIRIVHALRNPFDIITTTMVMNEIGVYQFAKLKNASNSTPKLDMTDQIYQEEIHYMFRHFDAVTEMINVLGKKNILEVHNCDLVDDPRGTVSRIFDFLEVETSTHYLDVCEKKVFKSLSRSRDLVSWPPHQREIVEKKMNNYPMLNRYGFTSD